MEETTQKNDKYNRAWEITKFVGWFLGSLVTMAVFGTPILTKEEIEKEEEEKRQAEARRKAEEERKRQEREEAERAEILRRASLTPEQRKIEDLEKELTRTNERCDSLQDEIHRQDRVIAQQQREKEDMDYEIRKIKREIDE